MALQLIDFFVHQKKAKAILLKAPKMIATFRSLAFVLTEYDHFSLKVQGGKESTEFCFP